MTNPDEEARTRRGAANKRMGAADLTRARGSNMMIAGAILFAGAVAAFAGFDSMDIPTWARQVILTIIAILFSGGMVFYVIGRASKLVLAQMADDRAERAAQHDEVMAELRAIKRNQTFLLARPGAEGVAGTFHHPSVTLPSPDTLDMMRQYRVAGKTFVAEPEPVPPQGQEDSKPGDEGEPEGGSVIAMPNKKIYDLGIHEGERRERERWRRRRIDPKEQPE